METHRITDETDVFYPDFMRLYEASFPAYERRTQAQRRRAISDPRFHLEAVLDAGAFAAFNAYWDFGDCTFIEHVAVDPKMRGGGVGSWILEDFFARNPKTCVLEIDPPEDDISVRRLRFYERHGFSQTPFFISPIYGSGGDEKLLILSRPGVISKARFEAFYKKYAASV